MFQLGEQLPEPTRYTLQYINYGMYNDKREFDTIECIQDECILSDNLAILLHLQLKQETTKTCIIRF